MPGTSHYVHVHLSDVIKPETVGVYVPDRVKELGTVDVIVYFHGNIIEPCGTRPNEFQQHGMEYYWATPNFKCLREGLEASDVNAILIAPTLSTQFGSSAASWAPRYGNLQLHNQFDWLLNETMAGFSPRIGKIVLAAHSAGGMPMMRILQATNAAKIDECWGFECLYFGTSAWAKWLHDNPNKMFHHFRRVSEMTGVATSLKTFDNFRDIKSSGKEHCALVKDNWSVALASSAALSHGPPPPAAVVAGPQVVAAASTARRTFWDFVMSIGR